MCLAGETVASQEGYILYGVHRLLRRSGKNFSKGFHKIYDTCRQPFDVTKLGKDVTYLLLVLHHMRQSNVVDLICDYNASKSNDNLKQNKTTEIKIRG